jgi:hypothetical protein
LAAAASAASVSAVEATGHSPIDCSVTGLNTGAVVLAALAATRLE